MASGATEVSICNLALSRLGDDTITSLSDNTKPARECNRLYAITRDMELRSHNWNFAIFRTSVAADETAPTWGYDYRYELPVDCLRLLEIENTEGGTSINPSGGAGTYGGWRIEAGNFGDSSRRFIVTSYGGPLYIRYISRVTDAAVFDTLFVNALAARLAMDLSTVLTNNNTLKEASARLYEHAIAEARAMDAIESSRRAMPETSWITARR